MLKHGGIISFYMVIFELIEKIKNGYIYKYYPENDKKDYGIVKIVDDDIEILKKSERDTYFTYACKVALNATGQSSGVVAGY